MFYFIQWNFTKNWSKSANVCIRPWISKLLPKWHEAVAIDMWCEIFATSTRQIRLGDSHGKQPHDRQQGFIIAACVTHSAGIHTWLSDEWQFLWGLLLEQRDMARSWGTSSHPRNYLTRLRHHIPTPWKIFLIRETRDIVAHLLWLQANCWKYLANYLVACKF